MSLASRSEGRSAAKEAGARTGKAEQEELTRPGDSSPGRRPVLKESQPGDALVSPSPPKYAQYNTFAKLHMRKNRRTMVEKANYGTSTR